MVRRAAEEQDWAAPDCICDSCKRNRREEHNLRHALVRSYSYRPRGGWAPKHGPETVGLPGYTIGVELETTAPGYNRVTGVGADNGYAADMRRPKMFWVPKQDGSVSGPEFASMPADMAYWYGHKRELSEMFGLLLHAGYRSHEGEEAGMHVNIDRSAFDTIEHLARFVLLVNTNSQWSLRMAQRTEAQAGQWACLGLKSWHAAHGWATAAWGNRGYNPNGRYTAVNKPSYQDRYEFRLPRGTLRLDRFFKNLEWTVAMVEYTRNVTAESDCTPQKFVDWVMGTNSRLYTYLKGYLRERFGGNVEAARQTAAVRRPRATRIDPVPASVYEAVVTTTTPDAEDVFLERMARIDIEGLVTETIDGCRCGFCAD